MPAPCLSSTAQAPQPDLRLHTVGGRRLSEAALEPTLDSCPAAASGSSMAARRSSRRRPRCHRGVHQWPERAAFDVRTAVCRRVCCPPPAGRSARTHCRAVWLLESLDVFRSVCHVKRDKRVHPGLDPAGAWREAATGACALALRLGCAECLAGSRKSTRHSRGCAKSLF